MRGGKSCCELPLPPMCAIPAEWRSDLETAAVELEFPINASAAIELNGFPGRSSRGVWTAAPRGVGEFGKDTLCGD